MNGMALIQATAEEIGIKVHLIDCYSTCYLQRYLAMCAKQLADQGIAAEEIVKKSNYLTVLLVYHVTVIRKSHLFIKLLQLYQFS